MGDWTILRGRFDVAACRVLAAAVDRLALPQVAGRQGSGYDKACLLAVTDPTVTAAVAEARRWLGDPPAVDAWWITYPTGSHIPPHTDPSPADGLAHLRLNLMVDRGEGGVLQVDGADVNVGVGDAVLFRPDTVVHAVTAVRAGTRRVLSVGTVCPADVAGALLDSALRFTP